MPRLLNSSPSDAELILESQHDPRVFWQLYDRWSEKILAYFYRRTLDPEDSADLYYLSTFADIAHGTEQSTLRNRDFWAGHGGGVVSHFPWKATGGEKPDLPARDRSAQGSAVLSR